jgi:hypothetical protein
MMIDATRCCGDVVPLEVDRTESWDRRSTVTGVVIALSCMSSG